MIFSYVAVVSDTDGSAFITKAEFDSLKNNFQAQIDAYNTSIDSKIDGAIASYLSGIRISSSREVGTYFPEKRVVAYGTANEKIFKACRPSIKGVWVNGNALAQAQWNYAASYMQLRFDIKPIDGVSKIVKRKWSTNSDKATEWLGWNKGARLDYNGYLVNTDLTAVWDATTGTWNLMNLNNGLRFNENTMNSWENYILIYPNSMQYMCRDATHLDKITFVGNNCGNGSFSYKTGFGIIMGTPTAPKFFTGSHGGVSILSNDPAHWKINYDGCSDPNIILLNTMSEDEFFNNTNDTASCSNYNEMPSLASKIKTGDYVTANADINKLVTDGKLAPCKGDWLKDISVTFEVTIRDAKSASTSGSTIVGKYNKFSNFYYDDTMRIWEGGWPEWYSVTYSGSDKDYGYYCQWVQKGWDKYVTYKQLYCSELQNEQLNSELYGSYSTIFRACEEDGKQKLTCYAGLPLLEIPERVTSVSIPVNFETATGSTDTSYYDMWIKYDPFTITTNPKNESNLFTGITMESHVVDGTTKAIKVRSGDTVKFAPSRPGNIFIKWSKNGNNGTGEGIFVIPKTAMITVED